MTDPTDTAASLRAAVREAGKHGPIDDRRADELLDRYHAALERAEQELADRDALTEEIANLRRECESYRIARDSLRAQLTVARNNHDATFPGCKAAVDDVLAKLTEASKARDFAIHEWMRLRAALKELAEWCGKIPVTPTPGELYSARAALETKNIGWCSSCEKPQYVMPDGTHECATSFELLDQLAEARAEVERLRAERAEIARLAEVYEADPVNAYDREQSWAKLSALLDAARKARGEE